MYNIYEANKQDVSVIKQAIQNNKQHMLIYKKVILVYTCDVIN